jgi:hypothetical protein
MAAYLAEQERVREAAFPELDKRKWPQPDRATCVAEIDRSYAVWSYALAGDDGWNPNHTVHYGAGTFYRVHEFPAHYLFTSFTDRREGLYDNIDDKYQKVTLPGTYQVFHQDARSGEWVKESTIKWLNR